MEAELFGTEAGAFTGAKARTGRFEAADGGTLFLDELGNLSGSGQAKLLRVLQTGEYERLGSSATRRTRVRVIAATNANLRQAIREGRFREDLFYRLNVIELEVPAARRPAGGHRAAGAGVSSSTGSRSRRTPSARSRATTGRATCASCRTPSSAPACSRPTPVIGAAALNLPAAARVPRRMSRPLDRPTIEEALEPRERRRRARGA